MHSGHQEAELDGLHGTGEGQHEGPLALLGLIPSSVPQHSPHDVTVQDQNLLEDSFVQCLHRGRY